jgi:hypothetical protein
MPVQHLCTLVDELEALGIAGTIAVDSNTLSTAWPRSVALQVSVSQSLVNADPTAATDLDVTAFASVARARSWHRLSRDCLIRFNNNLVTRHNTTLVNTVKRERVA